MNAKTSTVEPKLSMEYSGGFCDQQATPEEAAYAVRQACVFTDGKHCICGGVVQTESGRQFVSFYERRTPSSDKSFVARVWGTESQIQRTIQLV